MSEYDLLVDRNLVVKAWLKGQAYRFAWAETSGKKHRIKMSYALLAKRIYRELPLAITDTIELSYIDEEGDDIMMTNTGHVYDAISSDCPRLTVHIKVKAQPSIPNSSAADTPQQKEKITGTPESSSSKDILKHILKEVRSLKLLVSMLEKNKKSDEAGHDSSHTCQSCDKTERGGTKSCPASASSLPRRVADAPSAPCGTFHPNIYCDLCNLPITGVRYKCGHCNDYDVCENCEPSVTQKHHADHVFLKIHVPINDPRWSGRPLLHPVATDYGVAKTRQTGVHTRSMSKECSAMFIRDVTYVDVSRLLPGTLFQKIWEMENNGDADWPSDCRVVFTGGHILHREESLLGPLTRTPAGGRVHIKVELDIPKAPGRYVSYFRLADPTGRNFGPPLSCDFIVEEEQGAPSTVADDAHTSHSSTLVDEKKGTTPDALKVQIPVKSNDAVLTDGCDAADTPTPTSPPLDSYVLVDDTLHDDHDYSLGRLSLASKTEAPTTL